MFEPSGPSVPAAQRLSVGDYWADQAGGFFELNITVNPVVTTIPDVNGVADSNWAEVLTWDSLEATDTDPDPLGDAFAGMLQAVRAGGASLPIPAAGEPAPLLLIVGTKPTNREVAYRATVNGRTYPVAYVATTTDHSTMCHEIGHLLGLQHVWGNSLWGEYGSPYCVMGSPAQDNSVWLTAAPTLAPVVPQILAGPRLGGATLVSWSQENNQSIDTMNIPERTLPDDGHLMVTLADAEGPEHLPRVVVVRPEGETTEWANIPVVVEIRRPIPQVVPDWDGGFDLVRRLGDPASHPDFERDNLNAPGLVIHALRSVTLLEQSDPQDARQRRPRRHGAPVHLGTIPLPLVERRDLMALTDRFTIDVVDWDAESGVATLKFDHHPRPVVQISAVTATVRSQRRPGPLFDAALAGPNCRGRAFASFWSEREVDLTYLAVSGGGAGEWFRWNLAGQEIVAKTHFTSEAERGTVVADLPVNVPTGPGTWRSEVHPITLDWTARGGLLRVNRVQAPGVVLVPCEVSAFRFDPTERASAGAEGRVAGLELLVPGLAGSRRQCTEWLFKTTLERAPQLIKGKVLQKGPLKVPQHWELDDIQSVLDKLTALGQIPVIKDRLKLPPIR